MAVVVAHADERAADAVLRGLLPQLGEGLLLAQGRGQGEGAAEADAGRHRLVDEGIERGEPSVFSISATSASPGPTWRRTKSAGGSSRARAPAGAVTEAESDTGVLGS